MNYKLKGLIAGTILSLCPLLASAMPITKTLTVSVYQVCATDGSNCSAKGPAGNDYFADSTNKIWAQAGISVTFNFVQEIHDSNYLNIGGLGQPSFSDLHSNFGTGGPSTTGVDMFLVSSFDGAYGVGWYGFGGLIMSMDTIMNFNCGGAPGCTGRIDTLAHELGHNFGLSDAGDPDFNPADPGHSSVASHLMAGGGYRNVPTTLADINPDGLGFDQLSAHQIAVARRSSLLRDVVQGVPEPGSVALVGLALVGMGAIRRRKPGA